MSSRRGRDRVLSPTCSVAIPTRAHVWGVLTVSGTENQLEIESERERVVGDTALKSICRDSLGSKFQHLLGLMQKTKIY